MTDKPNGQPGSTSPAPPASLPQAHAGRRAVAMLLNRVEEIIPHASPQELAQLCYGLRGILTAMRPPDAPDLEQDDPRSCLDEIPPATAEQQSRVRALFREIIGKGPPVVPSKPRPPRPRPRGPDAERDD